MMDHASKAEVIRQIVRGERLWTDLELLGAGISFRDEACEIEYTGDVLAIPEVVDLARGFQSYQGRPGDLREWASVLLAGSAFLDLGGLESRPVGEVLLDALWDASETGQVSEKAREVIQQLAG